MLLKCLFVPYLARIPQSIGTVGLSCLFRRQITQDIWKDQTSKIIKKEKKIFLIEHEEKWEEILPLISRDVAAVNAVGFDTEWIVKGGKRNPVALLQLATYSGNCVVLRLNNLQSIPPSLKDMMEDKQIVKVGVGCEHDDKNLSMDYNLNVRGWMDLRHLVLQDNARIMKFALDRLSIHYLGRNLNKDWKLKLSNWESSTLAQKQVIYAAEDAAVGLHILLAQLNRLWNPAFQESWEKLTCRAIREVCEPFLELDFQYRHEFGAKNNSKTGEKLQAPNTNTKNRNAVNMTQLQNPNGEFLSYCTNKKALWYISEGLGDVVSEFPSIVKLKFGPSERANASRLYRDFLIHNPKICFVCGKEDSFIFKNVIPFYYRKYFPYFLLSQITDIVILCVGCLKESNLKDNELSMKLAEDCDEIVRNDMINIIRSAAETLKNRSQLSLEQIQSLEKTLKDYFHTDTITEELITQAAVLQTPIVEHFSHNYKIFKLFEKIGLIHLEERCRQWFLDSMKPKFMPEIWSSSSNIEMLKKEMSRYPLENKVRQEYKIALVGTEGEIDVPYVPRILTPKSNSKDMKLNDHM